LVPFVVPIILTSDDAEAQALRMAMAGLGERIESMWLNWQFPVSVARQGERRAWRPRSDYPADGNLLLHTLGREHHRPGGGAVWFPCADILLFLWRGFDDGFGGLGAQDGAEGRGYALLGDRHLDALLTGRRDDRLPEGVPEWLVAGAACHEIWHALGSPGRDTTDPNMHTRDARPDIGLDWWLAPNVMLTAKPDDSLLRNLEALRA